MDEYEALIRGEKKYLLSHFKKELKSLEQRKQYLLDKIDEYKGLMI